MGGRQDVNRRMLEPISGELLEIEERHLVDYGVAVTAGGGEEAVDVSPAIPRSRPELTTATASPGGLLCGLSPDPVRTAFNTAPAFPRSSRSSTSSKLASG